MCPRIHPLTWDDRSLRGNVYSRHDPFSLSNSVSSSVVKYCPFSVFARLALEQSWSIERVLVDLRTSVRIHATNFPVILHRSGKFDLLSTLLVALPRLQNYRALRVFPYRSNIWKFSRPQFCTHFRYCSVDTELIDGNNFTKKHFACFVAAIEM